MIKVNPCFSTVLPNLPLAVVEFCASKTVAIVPTSWFCGDEQDQCFWPKSQATKLAKAGKPPNESWNVYEVKVLGRAGK